MKHIPLALKILIIMQEYVNPRLLNQVNLNESLIAAPHAGVVLLYIGQYTPSERIAHNTVMFPMTQATCVLIPINAAAKIPGCSNMTTSIRHTRFVTDVISIGLSSAALATATTSIILTKNLEKTVYQLQTNMESTVNRLEIGEARSVQFENNQIKLGTLLQQSQRMLNSTISEVNVHASTLETHDRQLNNQQRALMDLQQQITNNKESSNNRFIHMAIQEIMNGRPTLSFLHPVDTHRVIQSILETNNITIPSSAASMPIVEMISRMILYQHIDFIPAHVYTEAPGSEVGKLAFTTYYAIPNERKSNFAVYKIISTPFIHQNKVVRVAKLPSFTGINPKDQTGISWSNEDLSHCVFGIITTCRQTPAITLIEQDNECLLQIIAGERMTKCRTENAKASIPHIQQIQDGRWLVSTNSTLLHCVRVATTPTAQRQDTIWSDNAPINIPQVAVVSVMNGTSIQCPGFNLPGPIIPDRKPSITIINNITASEQAGDIIDIHAHLTSNKTWEKLPYVTDEVDALLDQLRAETIPTSLIKLKATWQSENSNKATIILGAIGGALIIGCVYIGIQHFKHSANRQVTITLPSLSA